MNTRLRFLLTVMTAVMLLLAGCGRDTETVKKRYLANGEKYLAQGKVKEATIMFRNAIKRDPKFGDAYARLGDAEAKRGELVSAMKAYQRAVELQADPEDSAGKLADIYLIAYSIDNKRNPRMLEEVALLSGQLLKKNAKSYHGLRLKGFLATAKSDLPAAEEAFRQADQVRPKQPELRLALAQILNQRNNWAEAESIATQITKDSPTYTQVYDFLLMEYVRRNEAPKAEQILAQRVANNPKIIDFRIMQARFYMGTNRKDQADRVLAEMMAKESEDPAIRAKVGDFLAASRQFDRAMEVFKTGADKYPAEKTAYRLRIAQLFLNQNKPKDAISVVDQALADDPKSNDALSMRASLQLQYGGKEQRQGAVADLQALIGRDPKNVVVRYNLARAYQTNGELDAARVQYNEVIKLSDRFAAAYLGSGQVALAQRNFARAIQDADAVLKFDGRNARARLIKTNALIQSGNLRQARMDLIEYVKDDPESADLNFQIALTDFGEAKYKDAELRFRALRAKFPSDLRLVFAEAEVMVRSNRAAEAVQLLKAERPKHPDDRTLRIGLATLSARAGDFATAETEYRSLLQSDPKNLDIYVRLGDMLRAKGQLPAAIEILRKGQQMAPTNPGANLQLALTLDAAGQKAEALPFYESVVRLDPENAIALNNLAFQYAELGKDLDLAMKFAQKAKQKAPGSDDVTDTMGWVYVKKQLNDEAITVFRDLIKRQPKNPLYHYHLGYALFQKGNKPDARQALQTALSLKPGKDDEALIRQLLGKVS
ncbi:MAG TPA: tetratricopeptide repeat protein [Paludibaculum sp.]|jgi:predicted Zn-dependent protease